MRYHLLTSRTVINYFLPRIHENPIGDDGLVKLVSGLVKLSSYMTTTVDASEEDSPDAEVPVRLQLKMLDIGACGATDVGIREVAKLVASNIGLMTLSLTGNKDIGDDVWIEFGDALRTNSQIKSLELHHNGFGDAGTSAVVDGVRDSSTITSLDLEGNRMEDAGALKVLDLLRTSSSLRSVQLQSGNNISEEILAEIDEVMKSKKEMDDAELTDI